MQRESTQAVLLKSKAYYEKHYNLRQREKRLKDFISGFIGGTIVWGALYYFGVC
jgi:hypothetical protein